MDPDVVSAVTGGRDPSQAPELDGQVTIQLRVDDSGRIEVNTPQGTRELTLRPLAELYGAGTGRPTIDPEDEPFIPLFLAIEQTIVREDQKGPARLTDGGVALTLDRLAMNPEGDPGIDPLARHLQLELRLQLSLNDYSRQEVRGALRKIGKSVVRHTRLAGPRGYLSFIREYVGM
jgi:hypothetical protein